jgi:site-specific DNA recombinase
MRAVIYARFSSDLQDGRSIADQVRLCREYAEQQGHVITKVYEDVAASGASVHGRPGIKLLLADAERGDFDLLLTESMSRIGRDEEDRANIRKRLKFVGVSIATPGDGIIVPMVDGIRAVIDSQQLEDLKHHTRRGMRGRVHEGRSAGGRTYGYDVLPPEPDGRGGFKRGGRKINSAEAAVVLRIFAEYVTNEATPRAIAKGLNEDGIRPPRGRAWNASTINGNKKRGNGILQNQLYIGRLIWNKVRMPKNPGTGKRVIRPNAKDAWVVQNVPELAIINATLFEAAQRRKAARSIGAPVHQKRKVHMLSGLLRCATCGGGLSVFGKEKSGRRRLRCSTHTESGSCPNNRTYYLDVIERAVLSALRAELRSPTALTEYVKAYHEERAKLAADSVAQRIILTRRLDEIERETERLVDGIAKGHGDPAVLGRRMNELVLERRQHEETLSTLPEACKTVALHPRLLTHYERHLTDLQAMLAAGAAAGDPKGMAAIRELVESVTVERDDSRPSGVKVLIAGRLNAVLGEQAFPGGVCSKAVAGAGIEPATYGL